MTTSSCCAIVSTPPSGKIRCNVWSSAFSSRRILKTLDARSSLSGQRPRSTRVQSFQLKSSLRRPRRRAADSSSRRICSRGSWTAESSLRSSKFWIRKIWNRTCRKNCPRFIGEQFSLQNLLQVWLNSHFFLPSFELLHKGTRLFNSTVVRTQPHPTNQVTGVLDRSKIEAYCRHTAVGIFYRNCWFSPLWEIICSVSKSEPFLGCSMVSFHFHEVSRWLFKDVPFSKTFSFSFVKITKRAAVVANCRLKVFQSFRQRN